MKALSDRTGKFTASVIRAMTRLSIENGAINLSQGYPDFDPPEFLSNRLSEVAKMGEYQQYTITWGTKEFRSAIAKKCERFMKIPVDPDTEVLATCGSSEAMIATIFSLFNPGEKVIIFSPYFENYVADCMLSEVEPVFVPLNPPEFNFDPEALEDAFRGGAKGLILCNPSNPSGKVFSKDELLTISFLAKKYDAYVIVDEVYEHIIYDGYEHTYIYALPGMKERTVCCSSLSKTFSITGWRLGYAISNPRLTERIRNTHDYLSVNCPSPLQESAIVGLEQGDEYYAWLKAKYTHMRDLFLSGLDSIGIKYTKPMGSYFILADISDFGYDDDYEFCVDMIREIGVGAVPGSSFFHGGKVKHLIRLHYAKKDETLNEALDRLSGAWKLKK